MLKFLGWEISGLYQDDIGDGSGIHAMVFATRHDGCDGQCIATAAEDDRNSIHV